MRKNSSEKVDYLLSHFHCGKRTAMAQDVLDAFVSWEGRLGLHEKLELEHTYSLHYGENWAEEK
jgi:hypothetical protein